MNLFFHFPFVMSRNLAGWYLHREARCWNVVELAGERKEEADKLQGKLTNIPVPQVRLITASGELLLITGFVQAPLSISQLSYFASLLSVTASDP